MADRTIRVTMYGDLDFDRPGKEFIWKLFRSQPLTRLRDISLSSNPARFSAHGIAASRFEHSVGVAYLAELLVEYNPHLKEQENILLASALCHDIGSPPFSHVAEIFMHDSLGRTHEQETEILLAPGTEIHKILYEHDIDPLKVIDTINGKGELGPIVAGSIDLDNIDNSIRLLNSIGYPADQYDPRKIIKAYCWPQIKVDQPGELHLDTTYLASLIGWVETRKVLYGLLRTDTHLASTSMLQRAMEFAFSAGHIDEDFFQLGESDALYCLATSSGQKASKLINRALSWNQYLPAYQQDNQPEDLRLAGFYTDWKSRKQFTDAIAEELKMPPEDVALHIGKNRGEKAIDLPFHGDQNGEVEALFSKKSGVQRMTVFFLADHIRPESEQKVADVVENLIQDLPESEAGQHSFL